MEGKILRHSRFRQCLHHAEVAETLGSSSSAHPKEQRGDTEHCWCEQGRGLEETALKAVVSSYGNRRVCQLFLDTKLLFLTKLMSEDICHRIISVLLGQCQGASRKQQPPTETAQRGAWTSNMHIPVGGWENRLLKDHIQAASAPTELLC